MLCHFELKDDGTYICSRCSYKTSKGRAKRNCTSLDGPSLTRRVSNFAIAASNHALAGNPTVGIEVVKERLAICKTCELFKPNDNKVGGICTHSSCGCSIQDNLDYLNKLAWADQECPLKKWGKVEGNPEKIEN